MSRLFAVDLGNTTVRFAPLEAGRLGRVLRVPTASLRSSAEVRRIVAALRRHGPRDAAAVASVVPAALPALRRLLGRCGVRRLLLPDPARILPHRLEDPAATGIDRLLAARAAWDAHRPRRGGLVVIQAGTAVTVDAVSARGVFLGGYILPGPGLWLDALACAARIPRFREARIAWRGANRPGRGTESAVLGALATGLPAAVAAAAAAALRAAAAQRILLTGGWAGALAGVLPGRVRIEDDLVLRGLARAVGAAASARGK